VYGDCESIPIHCYAVIFIIKINLDTVSIFYKYILVSEDCK
jgi:hypothetical protein